MKILYYITRSDWGGAQAHLLDLVSELSKKEIRCEVVIGEKGLLYERLKELGIKVHHLETLAHAINPISDIKAIIGLKRIIKQVNPDIVHLHSTKAGWIGRIAARIAKEKIIFTAHGWCFTEGVAERRRKFGIMIEKALSKITDKVICVSKYDEALALREKVIKPEQVVTIYNGVRASEMKEVLKLDENDSIIKIVMVARFAAPKDQETLIRAMSFLDQDVHVYFIGAGDTIASAKLLTKEKNLEKRVHFLGDKDHVVNYLKDANVFVLSSNYEGFPISIIEAMSVGLPIVASNVGGVSELVKHKVNGLLFDKGNVEELSSCLKMMISDELNRIEKGKQSKKLYEQQFTLENCIERTLAVYRTII